MNQQTQISSNSDFGFILNQPGHEPKKSFWAQNRLVVVIMVLVAVMAIVTLVLVLLTGSRKTINGIALSGEEYSASSSMGQYLGFVQAGSADEAYALLTTETQKKVSKVDLANFNNSSLKKSINLPKCVLKNKPVIKGSSATVEYVCPTSDNKSTNTFTATMIKQNEVYKLSEYSISGEPNEK